MARLTKPHLKALSKDDLEQHPVWVWDDKMEGLQPISEPEPDAEDYGTLFIKARFQADEHSFDGYLIGGSTFYAFGLFVAGKEFVMNLNLPNLIAKNMPEIYHLLKCEPFNLFPIRYESSVRLLGGRRIEGMLNP